MFENYSLFTFYCEKYPSSNLVLFDLIITDLLKISIIFLISSCLTLKLISYVLNSSVS